MFHELIPSSGSMEMYIESEGKRERERERERERGVERWRERERVRERLKGGEREKERERERLKGGERESFFVSLNPEQLQLFHIIELIRLNYSLAGVTHTSRPNMPYF